MAKRPSRIACLTLILAACTAPAVAFAQPGELQQPAPSTRVRASHRHDTARDLLSDALTELTLNEGQRGEVESIRHEALAKHAAVKRANRALLEALADDVEKGAFDGAALRAKVQAALGAAESDAKARASALDKLHVVLDKDQRQKLAEAIAARIDDDDAETSKSEVRRLAEDLALDADQKKDLAAYFKDHAKADRDAKAQATEQDRRLLDAFKSDKLAIEKLVTPAGARAHAQREIDNLLGLVERLSPKLTADQRALCATALRDRAGGSAVLRL